MKVYVCRTSGKFNSGYIEECDNLEKECEILLESENFYDFPPELVIRKPDVNSPLEEKEKCCDWVIEIYDDYRE